MKSNSNLFIYLAKKCFFEGKLNKKLLAAYLFADPEHAKTVNGIIHPKVKEDFKCWVSQNNNFPLVAIESAILIEAGFADEVDVIAMVYAPLELRLERLAQRDYSSTKEQIMKRIQSQMGDEEKKAMAHFIIVNDEEKPLIPQIIELMNFASL